MHLAYMFVYTWFQLQDQQYKLSLVGSRGKQGLFVGRCWTRVLSAQPEMHKKAMKWLLSCPVSQGL